MSRELKPVEKTLLDESVLVNIKKLLGISESDNSFDMDVIANINAALFPLKQRNAVLIRANIMDERDTYRKLLGDDPNDLCAAIQMYIFCKAKPLFETDMTSYVINSYEDTAKEIEATIGYLTDVCEGDVSDG